MDVIWEALRELLSVQHFLYLSAGIAVGLLVGILPGMGGVAGMALLLPFVYGMDQTSALALMIGMLATTAAGDAFASILMGIPGGSSSATILDGFPLSRDGHAARALTAAFTSSMLGGLFGVVILTGAVFVARPLILGIGMGEQLLLVILALTMVGSLTGRTPLKGLAACGLGLLIGAIGSAPATGQVRFTFGTVYLSDGIPLIVLALGIFAMPEIVDLMRQQSSIAGSSKLGSGWRQGVTDTLKHWWLVMRVSCLGAVIGILPGVGGSTADWLAYGHVVQSSKDRSRFGSGDIRGVIAPEATNNATRGGDLIPTLFFGIPGSGSMALLLGAFVLIGLEPGARMVRDNLDLTFVIIWSLAIGNVLGALICMALAGPIARLTLVRYGFLAPLIVVLMIFTAYQATRSWGDLFALMVLTVVGLYMKRFDWSRPALIVGFVLSPGLEASLYQTAQVYGFSFLARPQSVFIALLVAISLAVGIKIMFAARPATGEPAEASAASRWPPIAFTALALAIVVYVLLASSQTAYLTRIYPFGVACVTLLLLGGVLVQQYLAAPGSPVLVDLDAGRDAALRSRPSQFVYLGWFILFLAMTWALGFTIASFFFVLAFITAECGRPVWRNAAFAITTVIVLMGLAYTLYMEYPPGFLPDLLSLPWWLQ